MKIILFSNFPEVVFERDIKPKLEECKLDLLRVVNVDRSKNVNLDDADVVGAMVEMMSSGQRKIVKDACRAAGKRCVLLERKGDWSRHFTVSEPLAVASGDPTMRTRRVVRPLASVPPPPPSEPRIEEPPPSSVEPTEASLEETQALIEMYEVENARLVQEKEQLTERFADQGKRMQLLQDMEKARLEELESTLRLLQETEKKVRELEAAPAAGTDEVSKALEHFRALWKAGYVKADDVLRMIFKE